MLLSSSWYSQALVGKKGNRSDAIILSPSPFINFVRPNLIWGVGDNAGPGDIWNSQKGFLVQSINPYSYELNFPTTGADGLYFDLDIEGVDTSQLTWEPVTHEGITATVQLQHITAAEGWDMWMDGPEDVTRVTLTGPRADGYIVDANGNYLDISEHPTYPGLIYKPKLPQTFELVGKDKNGNEVVTYGFVLQKWFLGRDTDSRGPGVPSHAEWCNGLGYRLPKVKDLTNAVCRHNDPDSGECYGAVGAKPSSSGNYYQRRIGAGFFTEWGKMVFYFGRTRYSDDGYPVSDPTGDNTFFAVATFDGQVFRNPSHARYEGLCVTP
ncbi:hypothetical protein [Gilliamella sp. ESL0250]|uniref:hypothetical protein n=1 Tax=Gilliamella sp. ESL0250 TaxID=2705036 RepID=UPI00157FF2FE|nr:hypothetical protein [Gilliamella sp. ESL0250]NUF50267.1 hypothetical protein [Gilliamella sp. ESL0250]